MMMKRIAHIEVPFGLGTINFPYSLSNIAGHGSFLCLAVSYLESDVVYLRIYAFSGISLSILFQYCREVPLWIPIRWNSLFLIINALMIALLIKEANDASNIPEEQEELFMTVFSKHSMKPVDFLRLMSIAERREVAEGDKIVEQGRKHQHLHLIQSGKLSVRRDNDQVGVIHAHQFAGAMSFLTWEGNYEIRRNARKEREGEFLLWEEFSDSGWGGLKLNLPGIGGSDGSERRKEREEIDWELGYADVTCEEDCVVYSWSFKDLHELLAEHPRIGLVVEGCISKGALTI
jgi:CRP-like cAMP-binding protein